MHNKVGGASLNFFLEIISYLVFNEIIKVVLMRKIKTIGINYIHLELCTIILSMLRVSIELKPALIIH